MAADRIRTKINILTDVLRSRKFTLIAKGDPDYPQGLEFDLPEEWIDDIVKCVKELYKKKRELMDKEEEEFDNLVSSLKGGGK